MRFRGGDYNEIGGACTPGARVVFVGVASIYFLFLDMAHLCVISLSLSELVDNLVVGRRAGGGGRDMSGERGVCPVEIKSA